MTTVDKVLAFLVGRPTDYDSSCCSLSEVALGVGATDGETLRALDELVDRGLAEYHWPREAPAYWRATNAARRGER